MKSHRQVKLIAVLVILLIVVILVLQNTEPVQVQLLLFSLTLPLAGLIVSMIVIGYILGFLTVLVAGRKGKGKKEAGRES